jgi:hypothetical protein
LPVSAMGWNRLENGRLLAGTRFDSLHGRTPNGEGYR